MLTDKEFEIQLKSDFLEEAADLVSGFEESLLRLESDMDSETLVHQIFRFIHTFKGSAAVAGFQELAEYAHHFEQLLSLLRNREIKPSVEIFDLLLKGSDDFKSIVKGYSQDPHMSLQTPQRAVLISQIYTIDDKGIPPSTSQATVQTNKTPAPQPRKPLILLVDDEALVLSILQDALDGFEHEFALAKNGQEALEIFKQKGDDIELIISDESMPLMTGRELLSEIRKAGSKVPFIILSGNIGREQALHYLDLGVWSYFPKPSDYDAILVAAKNAIASCRFHRDIEELAMVAARNYLTFHKVAFLLQDKYNCRDPILEKLSDGVQEIGDIVQRLSSRS